MKNMKEMNLDELRNANGGVCIAMPKKKFPEFPIIRMSTDPDPDFPDGPFGRDPVRAGLPGGPCFPFPVVPPPKC